MTTGPRPRAEAMPRQFDLFSGAGAPPSPGPDALDWTPLDPARLDDGELVAAIPLAGQAEAPGLAREAVRRGLADAVPALETLCRRFTGFGLDHEVSEQVAALGALAALGGKAAVTRLIVSGAVRGPGRRQALDAASALGCQLPHAVIVAHLSDNDPDIRAAACRCARANAGVMNMLIDLLSDLHPPVAHAAAIALGRMGRREGMGLLSLLLRTEPTREVIAALAFIADDDAAVRLGQTALTHPDLAPVVLAELENSEAPRAVIVAAGVKRRLGMAE